MTLDQLNEKIETAFTLIHDNRHLLDRIGEHLTTIDLQIEQLQTQSENQCQHSSKPPTPKAPFPLVTLAVTIQ